MSCEGVRSLYEYALSWVLDAPLKYISPKGDGHPVLIIPGLGSADGATHYLRGFLDHLGYETFPWGQGWNLGPRNGLEEMMLRLEDLVRSIHRDTGGQQVSIVGWSLGGIYARELTKLCPEVVRQVITLGSPFKMNNGGTNIDRIYELLSKDSSHKDPEVLKRLEIPPPVPFTSLYSKTDGIVHWKSSIEDIGENSENIEISGASHLGLGHNPVSLFVIADRLAQTKSSWKPYSRE